MKITNSKQIFLNDNYSLQNGVSPKSDEKFFDARFDELEGLHIEKSDTKEQHQDKNKIYTCASFSFYCTSFCGTNAAF